MFQFFSLRVGEKEASLFSGKLTNCNPFFFLDTSKNDPRHYFQLPSRHSYISFIQFLEFIPRSLKFIYYVSITAAFCANILVVAQTTILSVFGASLALRGPDGSMMVATDGLYQERSMVFNTFGYGLGLTVSSVVMVVWLHLHWEASLVCCAISVFTIIRMRSTYYRMSKKFDFDESQTVDFQDIFDGPANISAVPMRRILEEGMRMASMNGLGGMVDMGNGGRKSSNKHSFDQGNDEEFSEEEKAFVRRQRMSNGKSQGLQTV